MGQSNTTPAQDRREAAENAPDSWSAQYDAKARLLSALIADNPGGHISPDDQIAALDALATGKCDDVAVLARVSAAIKRSREESALKARPRPYGYVKDKNA